MCEYDSIQWSDFHSDLSRRNRFIAVPVDATLQKVIEVLAKGVHRVPVVNAQGTVINVISQSAIIKFLSDRLHEVILESSGEPRLDELKSLGTTPVLTVGKTTDRKSVV